MTKKGLVQNIDLDMRKAIVLIATFFVFFVLPISVLTTRYYPTPTEINIPKEEVGRVAGEQTTALTESNTGSNSSIIDSESIFMIIGVLSLTVTIILVIYFLVESVRSKKKVN